MCVCVDVLRGKHFGGGGGCTRTHILEGKKKGVVEVGLSLPPPPPPSFAFEVCQTTSANVCAAQGEGRTTGLGDEV